MKTGAKQASIRADKKDSRQRSSNLTARGPLMVQSLTSAKSKFLSLEIPDCNK